MGLTPHKSYLPELVDTAKKVLADLAGKIATRVQSENKQSELTLEKAFSIDRDVIPTTTLSQPMFAVTPFRQALKEEVKNAVGANRPIRWQESALNKAERTYQHALSQKLEELGTDPHLSRKGAFRVLTKEPPKPLAERKKRERKKKEPTEEAPLTTEVAKPAQETKAEDTKGEETKAEEKDAAQGSDMGPPAKKAKVTAPDIAKYEPTRYESITLTMPVIEPIKAAAPKLTRAKTIYPKGSY